MHRYFFDVKDYKGIYRDEFGDDYNDLDDAIAQVQCILIAIVRDEMPGSDHHALTCEVRDDTRRVVYRGELSFRGTRLAA